MTKKNAKSTQKKKQTGNSFARITLIFLLVMTIFAGALLAVERQQLPQAAQDNSYVIEVYALRDSVKKSVTAYINKKDTPKKPLSITPSAQKTEKPELGYSNKDREGMEALIREEGTTP